VAQHRARLRDEITRREDHYGRELLAGLDG